VTVRRSIIEAVKALNSCLITWNYKTIYAQTGAMACRKKVSGNGWSNHSYGVAIDLNWQLNPYGGSRHHIPSNLAAAICRIRTNNGKQVWNWGGYWRGTKDWMHFDIVCTPADLATGINYRTVTGKPIGNVPVPPKAPVQKPIQEDEEDMGSYIRDDQSGAIFHVYGERYRHLSKKQWDAREGLARLGGKPIVLQNMHPWGLAKFLIDMELIKDPT
jgi:hypothetical protein